MAWLFSWKKNQKVEPAEDTGTEEDNAEYVFVEKKRQAPLPPSQSDQSGPGYPTGNLYPYIPPGSEFSSMTIDPTVNQGESTRFLNDIPFKLCKRLEIQKNNDLEIDRLRINEIVSFIERIESNDYNYSFSVEEGVTAEMNSINDQ
ncbi:uncharacterized protein LOC143258843 [Megalopta genalis]|uniref:uncharacterized protein LOC143258843 n=1 Tax=Megalopta genalis TaxID=115081 RepID=UPI003FD39739